MTFLRRKIDNINFNFNFIINKSTKNVPYF